MIILGQILRYVVNRACTGLVCELIKSVLRVPVWCHDDGTTRNGAVIPSGNRRNTYRSSIDWVRNIQASKQVAFIY